YVLPSRSYFAADAHLERREQLCEHPAFARHDWTKAEINYPNAGFTRWLGRLLPLATHTGKKSTAGFTLLIKNFIIAIAIDSRRRCADECAGFLLQLRHRFAHQVRAVYTTVANLAFLIVGPTSRGDVLAGEVDDHVKAVQFGRLDRILIRMPFDFVGLRL